MYIKNMYNLKFKSYLTYVLVHDKLSINKIYIKMNKVFKEIKEFNESFRNKGLLKKINGYVFISCADFSHKDGKYTNEYIGNGLPLTIDLAKEKLFEISNDIEVYISDNEIYRKDLLIKINTNRHDMLQSIKQSMEKVKKYFPYTYLLSSIYTYKDICFQMDLVKPNEEICKKWSIDEDIQKTKVSYKRRYAELFLFFKYCVKNNKCPILIYSGQIFKLVNSFKKDFKIPIIFIDIKDPHF